ncbi:Uncharacterized protein OS=Desulfosporosinus sp. OT GN=DOT_5016 PE=4 SV=1: HDOD [Gemmataceae bacterium]|nr:Uncharacterized protein OS=Desulfosporosinus sp. OT GN=DOT_5016 PE=4 SV=1: HDOD [Gemmataceae bacterium]VTT97881.1 Uncharacterized protein OS=Desulfosporosinus sp. OT GN=DOT_5016 PE=4 SV=1: HDOD [Gemmataceae bacterium]
MILSLFTKGNPRSAAVAEPNPRRLRLLADLERIESYPTLSETAVQVATLLAGSEPSIAEVSSIVRRDTVLTATILRMANTWTYRGNREVEDVQQAVLRLGLQESGRVLTAVGMRRAYSHPSPRVQERCDALFRHGLLVARLSAGAARHVRAVQPGVAFTAGLLHDIGRLVLAVKCPEEVDAGDPLDYAEGRDTIPREREWFGVDHCAIGYQLGLRNSLPEGVVRVVLNHHRPHDEQLQPDLVALVAAMDDVANYAHRERRISGYRLAACPFRDEFAQAMSSAGLARFEQQLPALVVQAVKDVRAMLKALA